MRADLLCSSSRWIWVESLLTQAGEHGNVRGEGRGFVFRLLALAIEVYAFAIVAAAVLTWVPIEAVEPVRSVLDVATGPVVAPVRAVLPPVGGIDASPLVAALLLFGVAHLLGR